MSAAQRVERRNVGTVVTASVGAAVNGTEKQFVQQIKDLARLNGWRTFHCFDSRRSDPGWPDLALVRGPIMIFIECKTERGRVTDNQQQWLAALKKVRTVRADLARPRHWPDIERALTAKEDFL